MSLSARIRAQTYLASLQDSAHQSSWLLCGSDVCRRRLAGHCCGRPSAGEIWQTDLRAHEVRRSLGLTDREGLGQALRQLLVHSDGYGRHGFHSPLRYAIAWPQARRVPLQTR